MRKFKVVFCFFLIQLLPGQSPSIDTTTYAGIVEFLATNATSGDYQQIIDLAKKAQPMAIEKFGAKSEEYLDLLEFEADGWQSLNDIPNSRRSADRTLEVARTVLDTTSERFADILLLQGNLHFKTGKLDSVRYFYHKAKPLYSRDNTGYTVCLTQLGVVNLHFGEISTALANFEESVSLTRNRVKQLKALPAADEARGDLEVVQFAMIAMMANLGFTYAETGYNRNAIELLDEAINELLSLTDKEHPYYAAVANLKIQAYSNLGQVNRAIEMGKEIVSLIDQPGKEHLRPQLALYNLNLARQLSDDRQLDSALVYVHRTLEVYRETGTEEHKELAVATILAGQIYLGLGNYDEALAKTEEGLAMLRAEAGKFNGNYREGQLNLADIYFAKRDFPEALILLKEVKKEIDNAYRTRMGFYGGLLSTKARTHEEMGEIEAAAQEYREVNECVLKTINVNLDFLTEREQLTYVEQINILNNEVLSFNHRNPEHQVGTVEALTSHLRLKEIVLGNRKKLIELLRNTEDAELRRQFTDWSLATQALAAEYGNNDAEAVKVDSLEALAFALETDLTRTSRPFREARKEISWRDIQQQLQPAEAVVEIARYRYVDGFPATPTRYAYVAFILRRDQESPVSAPLFFEDELPSLRSTKRLYAHSESLEAQNLQQLLYQPLSKHLEGIGTIYYSPAGQLHRVNFGAIPITSTENLAQRYDLHQLGNSRQVTQQIADNDASISTAVVFGGIDYNAGEQATGSKTETDKMARGLTDAENQLQLGDAYRSLRENQWPFLEHTAREAEMVDEKLGNTGYQVTTHTGEEADEGRFKQLGKSGASPRLIHLATHGFFFPKPTNSTAADTYSSFERAKHPLVRSGLILAGGNQAWLGKRTDAEEDGVLTAYEIAQMDLSNTELVVLSACETGLGDIQGGEGVFGLQRAFKLAGVKYVLMSLWNVKDEKTYQFMEVFYDNLERGATIPLAYQRAQSKMQRKYALPFNPRNWAGFILLE